MRLHIEHRTTYRYDKPVHYAIQTWRLWPRPHKGLFISKWQIQTNNHAELPSLTDGYGNIVHNHSINKAHEHMEVVVEGDVETWDTDGVLVGMIETLPPAFYLRPTDLTAADKKILSLSAAVRDQAKDPLERMHVAMALIRQSMAYRTGATNVTTTASQALQAGAGVCQDYAHVFISIMRDLGIPARYVSGYLRVVGSEIAADACHAWAEGYVENLGWVGFDPSNGLCPTQDYVRIACGLDYLAAAPIRGLRWGASNEGLDVSVRVCERAAQQ